MAETGISYGQVAPYAAGAGAATQAFATLAQGLLAAKRSRAITRYNAQTLEENARAAQQAAELEAQQQLRAAMIAEQELRLVEQAGAYREARLQEQHEATLGETRAMIAGAGLTMTGSPLRVYEEQARQQAWEILASRYQTKLQQRALEEEAVQQRYGAALSRYGGQERLRIGRQQAALTRALRDDTQELAAWMGAASSLLGGSSAMLAQRERQQPYGPTVNSPVS